MLGSTSTTKLPSTGARTNRSRPTAAKERPTASGFLSPNRMTSFADSPIENAPMITFAGRKARPTFNGLYPSTNCRYWAERKNQANIAAAQRTPTVFETEMLRCLKSRSGTRGAETRDSITRKSPSNAAAAPSRPSVCAEVQPAWLPFTIA